MKLDKITLPTGEYILTPTGATPEYAIYMLSSGFFADLPDRVMNSKQLTAKNFALVVHEEANWNDAYSPWYAPALRMGDADFGGHAEYTIKYIEDTLKPSACEQLAISQRAEKHILLGYSLSGLAALYGLYISDAFGGAGSCSGSYWFDGFAEYCRDNTVKTRAKVYMSLGRKEVKTRNTRLSCGGECAELIRDKLIAHGCNAEFEWTNGGHDFEPENRLARAISALLT